MQDARLAIPADNVMPQFTRWYRWADRREIPDGVSTDRVLAYGGVYLLAHFPRDLPAGPADHRAPAVFYVGEGSRLGRRWDQFARSGFRGLPGHSGGHTYRAWTAGAPGLRETLCVAALPIWFADEGDTDAPLSRARRFRLYLEQRILWDLVANPRGRGATLLNRK
ncbi:MAG: hypothetical protein KBG48_07650 [Kofleriaceae bacterium]|nr:hypothetical protein [Kofleriaceae bacterium]MBP9167244.1 hypothetical protein [Kofleriaceae bacterium]MBP9863119.1 hypothetical protein [Kofleriaceae bacterium]